MCICVICAVIALLNVFLQPAALLHACPPLLLLHCILICHSTSAFTDFVICLVWPKAGLPQCSSSPCTSVGAGVSPCG